MKVIDTCNLYVYTSNNNACLLFIRLYLLAEENLVLSFVLSVTLSISKSEELRFYIQSYFVYQYQHKICCLTFVLSFDYDRIDLRLSSGR